MAPWCSFHFAWLLLLIAAPVLSFQDPFLSDSSPPLIQDVMLGSSVTVRHSMGSFIEYSPGVKHGELISCIRLRIPSVSRLRNLSKYANSFRVKLEASTRSALQSSQKVDVCFHGNESMALGKCMKESWQSLEKGIWSGLMSPFETKFIDLRMRDSITDFPLEVSVHEEFWPFRLVFLVSGVVFLLLAPVISSWVPFYYSSAMMLGIFLIVLILLFQGMKLLPTGRKSTLYILLYGSVVGMGTVILHYFTSLISSLLEEIGISNEAYNPVAIFVIVGIALMGAWLGYWGVRKMILSEDGTIDVGTAQFVKWAIRIVASIMILQSSHDPLLAMTALTFGISVTWIIKKLQLQDLMDIGEAILLFLQEHFYSKSYYSLKGKPTYKASQQFAKAEFLSKNDRLLRSPHRASPTLSRRLEESPPSGDLIQNNAEDHYSSFHKMPSKKRMSPAEWTNFTQRHTRKAMQELTASPKFSDWFLKNADRVVILPTEHREDRNADEIQTTAYMPQVDEGEEDMRKPRFFRL